MTAGTINALTPIVAIWLIKATKHPVPDRVKPSFLTSRHYDTQPWASECPDVKNYKWRLTSVRQKMLYSHTHIATEDNKGLSKQLRDVDKKSYLMIKTNQSQQSWKIQTQQHTETGWCWKYNIHNFQLKMHTSEDAYDMHV